MNIEEVNSGRAARSGGMAESEAARVVDDEEVTEPGTRRAGVVKLTDRDRDMLGLLVLARYLTAPQVHRLCFEGRHVSLAYRRLLKLTRSDGGSPFVRQRFFRAYDGNRIAVWAPTPHGLAAAALRTAGLPELPRHDVGANFLEHTIQLNEFLVALWPAAGDRTARAAHASFRWTPSDAVRLTFNEYVIGDPNSPGGRKQLRIIQPDAMLELPGQRRRYFLECEMGGHTISPGPSKPPGATLSKAERYNEYLTTWADSHARRTHYAVQYPDGFTPQVLFLVRTAGRAGSINAALAHWREKDRVLWQRFDDFRAATFDEAAVELRRVAGLPPLVPRPSPSPRRHQSPPALTLTPDDVDLLRRYLFESTRAIHRARAAFRELRRADLPEYPGSLETFKALIARLSGMAPPS